MVKYLRQQPVTMHGGEAALLLGPWINHGTWDGSYAVLHEDGTIGYWFPSKFKVGGVV